MRNSWVVAVVLVVAGVVALVLGDQVALGVVLLALGAASLVVAGVQHRRAAAGGPAGGGTGGHGSPSR